MVLRDAGLHQILTQRRGFKMKRSIYLAALVVPFIIGLCDAQTIDKFGVKLSVTSSNIYVRDQKPLFGNSYPEYTIGNSINPSIGLFADLDLMDNVIFEAELTYLRKGSRESLRYDVTTQENPDGDGSTATYVREMGLQYVELGLNLKPLIRIGDFRAYGIVGSSVNYLTDVTGFLKQDFKDIVMGYRIGAGVEIGKLANTPVFVEIKYSGDFSKFYSSQYGTLWNRAIIASIGIGIQ
jgi:opacity protein-like surface antigen